MNSPAYPHPHIRFSRLLFSFLVLLALPTLRLHAQMGRPLEELLLPNSPVANGMGGTSAVLPSTDAAAAASNAAQLGLFALDNTFNVARSTLTSDGPPMYFSNPMTRSTTALNAGVNLAQVFQMPFPLSIGFGYTHSMFDGSDGDRHEYRRDDGFLVAVGVEYYLRVAAGMAFRNSESNLNVNFWDGFTGAPMALRSPITGKATDWGMLVTLPITRIISETSGSSLEVLPGIHPVFDVSMCYVETNYGDIHVPTGPEIPLFLPKVATAGVATEASLEARRGNAAWRLLTASLARQVDDIAYREIPGRLNFFENVIGGDFKSGMEGRTGWQIEIGEILALRRGTISTDGIHNATAGYSVKLGGLLKFMSWVSPTLESKSWFDFVCCHIDVQYHESSFDRRMTDLSGTTSQGLNLVIKGMPWR